MVSGVPLKPFKQPQAYEENFTKNNTTHSDKDIYQASLQIRKTLSERTAVMKKFLILINIFLLQLWPAKATVTQEEPFLAVSSTDICTINWESVVGRTYLIQYSFDLKLWDYLPLLQEGTGNQISYWFQCGAPQVYLRLEHTDLPTGGNTFDADFDGDGYSNIDELLSGTSPFIFTPGAENPGGGNPAVLPDYPSPEGTHYILNFDVYIPQRPEYRIQLALGKTFEVLAQNGTTSQLNGQPHDFPVHLPTGPTGVSITTLLTAVEKDDDDDRKLILMNYEKSKPSNTLLETRTPIELIIPKGVLPSNAASISSNLQGTSPSRKVSRVEVEVTNEGKPDFIPLYGGLILKDTDSVRYRLLPGGVPPLIEPTLMRV